MLAAATLCLILAGQDVATKQAPLLPEGTIVTQAKGVLSPAKTGRGMVLRLIGTDAATDGSVRLFTLLPSRMLERLEQLHDTNPLEAITITGALTLYDGQNWLLPIQVEREMVASKRDVPDTTPTLPEVTLENAQDAGDDESIADIVADLESAVGTLRRGVRSAQTTSSDAALVADDLVIVSRRGRISRHPSGTWVLLLDADSSHHADPPLVLLPSRVLAEIVRHVRRNGPGESLLVSGTVQHYRNRRYLLPSGWRVPHERQNLKR
jgi:hypothetical protein